MVTRHRESLAVSRLAFDRPVPLTVVGNGFEIDIIETGTGRIWGQGIEAVPTMEEAMELIGSIDLKDLSARQRDMERRIYLTYAQFDCAFQCGG